MPGSVEECSGGVGVGVGVGVWVWACCGQMVLGCVVASSTCGLLYTDKKGGVGCGVGGGHE